MTWLAAMAAALLGARRGRAPLASADRARLRLPQVCRRLEDVASSTARLVLVAEPIDER